MTNLLVANTINLQCLPTPMTFSIFMHEASISLANSRTAWLGSSYVKGSTYVLTPAMQRCFVENSWSVRWSCRTMMEHREIPTNQAYSKGWIKIVMHYCIMHDIWISFCPHCQINKQTFTRGSIDLNCLKGWFCNQENCLGGGGEDVLISNTKAKILRRLH